MDIQELTSSLGIDLSQLSSYIQDLSSMDESEISPPDSPDESAESATQSTFEKQRASLQTYLDSVPYDCESIDYMQERLEEIVGKIIISTQTRNWYSVTTWDGMLQCWLLFHYPMSNAIRAKLVRLYYELCLIPGLEPRMVRSWADMVSRLLGSKADQKRKLDPTELQLPWEPLWNVMQKELWPKKRLQESSRNMINILLYVAEHCCRYYPTSEIPNMLSTFVPMVTKENILTMIPVMTSFLPLASPHLYMPTLFRLWEAFNSSIMDDRLLDLCGELSEEYVAEIPNDTGQSGTEYKDVGIWTEAEWTLLMGKTLNSMNVPVGAVKGASTTATHADSMGDRQSLRIRKPTVRFNALAKIIVFSMAFDAPMRSDHDVDATAGFLAGSRAMDSLDKLITSTESFFHPSNAGHWTIALTSFLHRLAVEFSKRWNEEKLRTCKTPVARRLTPAIRQAFVTTLRTPALLAMFAKDPLSSSYAQGALRLLAMLEPNLVMPELLERAYSGLEVINETHRTTAVMTMLSGVALPLVNEKIWPGGQKHVVPLLELCIPGIDLNDPMKTLCASMFIVSVAQHIKFGDLSMHHGAALADDEPAGELMDVDDSARLPDGKEDGSTLSREEERALTRECTAGFADWVTSLFRRIFALFENLPEEGGRRNTTGGKMEEAVIKSIKGTLDVVCLHLSDQLFDLVLKLVFEYATTNARSNAVRAFGQLVSCLARVKPDKVIAKFLPYCSNQIREELKHGASSIRTTSTHQAVPSDTTLHWNMSILRGCLGYGGSTLLQYKEQFIDLIKLLIDKTKSERGYSGTGRLINRILHTIAGIYPINARFVNTEEWESPEFKKNHNLHWGKLYKPEDVKIEWHVPSPEEVDFVLEILDTIAAPTLDKVEELLDSTGHWDNVARNDFCRYLHAVRSIWSGLPTIFREGAKETVNPCVEENYEVGDLLVRHISVAAGFVLEDPSDPRYKRIVAHRVRFGQVVHRASIALRQPSEGEDHIDAVISVSKAIDVYLLEYAMTRTNYDTMQKTYSATRELSRMWPRQKENSRAVLLKRAQLYHAGRVYMEALYRRRSGLDDQLLEDLIELSLSPYTRVRRHAQAVLNNACGYYIRSTRFALPRLYEALNRGSDADRMKGALYVLWNKGIAAYAISDGKYGGRYLLHLLECQHQEKPSIQKLVNTLAQSALVYLTEESIHTNAFTDPLSRVEDAVQQLSSEFTTKLIDQNILREAVAKLAPRVSERSRQYDATVSGILEIANRPTTHWRYVQFAVRFLHGLLRRDAVPSPALAKFLAEQSISPHPTIRTYAQKALVKMTAHIKIRTYSKTIEELWLDKWRNPLQETIPVGDPAQFLQSLTQPIEKGANNAFYVDKLNTGFLSWLPSVKAYRAVISEESLIQWEQPSLPALHAMDEVMNSEDYFATLASLLGQESGRNPANLELRGDHIVFTKSISKMFEYRYLDQILSVLEPLLVDADRYKQRAAAEMLAGLLRGSKHWPLPAYNKLWSWTGTHMERSYAQIKPDTLTFWESLFNEQLSDRDSRRIGPLVGWILSLPLEFHSDSAFAMSKNLTLFNTVVDCAWLQFAPLADQYATTFLDNAHTGYAEVRAHIATTLAAIITEQWQPWYPSTDAFLEACRTSPDPLGIRRARYIDRVSEIARQLPTWKEQRYPPPRVSQSQYDKVGLTMLQLLWTASHGPQASLMFPYVICLLPEILRMAELNDSSELQKYSHAVLYILSAVPPPPEYVEVIADNFLTAITSSTSWRIRLNALPTFLVFFYRNLMSMSSGIAKRVMDVLVDCLADENVEVREMASKMLSGVVRCSQRQSIIPLKDRFVRLAQRTKLLPRRDPKYAESLRALHSSILGICALIESFPYSVEPWMPPLTEVLANHATDPPPISTTIRKCASEFKKTHQDTWHKDQQAFDEDQLQSLSTMLVGTSYYA